MAHKYVQLIIGSLLTDEELRRQFIAAPDEAFAAFAERGWELTHGEVDALLEIDARLWSAVAAKLPSRLQRCSLRSGEAGERLPGREGG